MKKPILKKTIWMLGLLLGATSVAWAATDKVISLRGDVALDAPSVTVTDKQWYDGDGKINRQFVQQPPLVPHDIESFSINREGNDCLSCHNWDSEMPGATKVGISHFLNRDSQALSNISPRRYFCTQCHVPQKTSKAIRPNIFNSVSDILKLLSDK